MPNKCCICLKIYNKKNKRRFYTFPEFTVCNQKSASRDKVLIEKRRNVWLQLTKRNLNRFSGRLFVCSDHFVSGNSGRVLLLRFFFIEKQVFFCRETSIFISN